MSPSPPALATAAATSGPEMPAMGAAMTGTLICSKSVSGVCMVPEMWRITLKKRENRADYRELREEREVLHCPAALSTAPTGAELTKGCCKGSRTVLARNHPAP